MGEAAKALELLDAEAYLAMEERSPVRHELLEGVPYAMAGATEAHNLIVGNLFYGLRPHARAKGCRLFVSDMKLKVASRTFYYPDLMVVCAEDPHPLYKERPCLVIEVLSEGTEAIDRREKLWRYRELPSSKATSWWTPGRGGWRATSARGRAGSTGCGRGKGRWRCPASAWG